MSEKNTTITRWDELTEAGRQAVARGDLVAATSAHRGALEDAEATAPDSARVASSLASLGQVRYQAKDYAEAEQLFRRAVSLRERLLGAEHPNVAQTLNNLAAVYVALGALGAAEPLLLRSLAITERHRGPSHPDVAVNLNNLAKLYFKRNEHARAEPLLSRLLELERSANSSHPKVATVLASLATVRVAQGDVPAAESLLREAEAIVGAQHVSVVAVRAKLEARRAGRATPNGATSVDPAAVSGPIVMPTSVNPTPAPMPAISESAAPNDANDGPPRRKSGPLPPNPWLAESEPPSVIRAESGDYAASARPVTESTVIVPSKDQEPIAPPTISHAPAPLPPLVVPPQVPREFGESPNVVGASAPAPVGTKPPIKEGPSVRTTSAHLEAAAAAISRFAPPSVPQLAGLPVLAPMPPMPSESRVASPTPAPVVSMPPSAIAAAAFGPPPVAPPPLVLPETPSSIAAPLVTAPLVAPPLVAPRLVPPPLVPPPLVTPPRVASLPVPPDTMAPRFAPPVPIAPPPLPPVAAPTLALELEVAPMPAAVPAEPVVVPRPVAKPASNEGPRFAEPKPRARRKPRLQPDGSTSSGGSGKLVVAALVLVAIGGGGWVAFSRGMIGGTSSVVASEPANDPAANANSGVVTPALATTAAFPAGPASPSREGGTNATNPVTGVAIAPSTLAPVDDEITSSPVPTARREAPRPAPPKPTTPAPITLPTISTEKITRGIDSTTKAKVDASLRPKVAAPAFPTQSSP